MADNTEKGRMKHRGSTIIVISILLTAFNVFLTAQEAAQAAKSAGQLAEPQEKRFNDVQPPELVMDILGIRPGFIVGEVGAGHGRVTVYIAARVGDKGKVYANDIDAAAVEYLKARCRRQGLANVEVILSLPDDARFPQNSLDLVVMTWVYHHVDDPVPLLKSLLSSLKPWGIVALVEPKPSLTEDNGRVLTWESVGEEARTAGFTLDAVIEDRLKADNVFVLRPAELGRIEQSIRDCIGWAKTKDFPLLYGVIADDPDFLEVHPDGAVVRGIEEFRKAEKIWASPDFKALRYEIRDLKIKVSQSGDVAWFFCLLDDINEWKGQPANWENTRWTGVLEKRDGRWVMVQQHFSFAAKD